MVDAIVTVSEARRQALELAKQAVPHPVQIRALIDTGASNTCIDPIVLAELGLSPTGSAMCNTASSGDIAHQTDMYDIGLIVPSPQRPFLARPTLPVMAALLFKQQGFHALIGREILAKCVFHYNGAAKLFTLAY